MQDHETSRDDGAKRPALASRRRLLVAGAAAPVLMTLANKPAMANECTLSASMSGNLSVDITVICGGLRVDQWESRATGNTLPAPFSPSQLYGGPSGSGAMFEIFGSTVLHPSTSDPLSLLTALQLGSSSFFAQAVAGVLNAADTPIPYGYSVSQLRIEILTNGDVTLQDGDALAELQFLNQNPRA